MPTTFGRAVGSLEMFAATHSSVDAEPFRHLRPPEDHVVLVVDDEEVSRLVLTSQLANAGYQVREALNGPEALRLLDEEVFDVVVLDIMMPKMSGYEVCRRLRQRFKPSELPVIFCSARDQISAQDEGYQAGGNDYLTKPVRQKDLLARVEIQIARSRASSPA